MSKKYIWWDNYSDKWIAGRSEPVAINTADADGFSNLNGLPIIKYVNNLSNDKIVLDIGVGTGRFLNNFVNYKKLYGIDFIEKFIIVANKIKPVNCELSVDDVVNLNFNKAIDIIFTMTCLQHILPDQIDNAIKNLAQLNANDIILWECSNDTYTCNGFEDKNDDHMWGHNYIELFKKYNYELEYSKLYINNITYLLHFKKIM